MALVLRKAAMPKNIALFKCMKGRPLATSANKTSAAPLSTSSKKTGELAKPLKLEAPNKLNLTEPLLPLEKEAEKPPNVPRKIPRSKSCPNLRASEPIVRQDIYRTQSAIFINNFHVFPSYRQAAAPSHYHNTSVETTTSIVFSLESSSSTPPEAAHSTEIDGCVKSVPNAVPSHRCSLISCPYCRSRHNHYAWGTWCCGPIHVPVNRVSETTKTIAPAANTELKSVSETVGDAPSALVDVTLSKLLALCGLYGPSRPPHPCGPCKVCIGSCGLTCRPIGPRGPCSYPYCYRTPCSCSGPLELCGACGPCGSGRPCVPCPREPCVSCSPCGPCFPCGPCGPCGPCATCSPCGPCVPCSPCGPCVPCSPCGPCASCSPCGPCTPCSPCGPCTPCSPCGPCTPCSPSGPCTPCSPCGPWGPCGICSPCGPCRTFGPCGPFGPCSPYRPCGPCDPCCLCGPCGNCSPCGPCDPVSACVPCGSCGPCGPCGACGPCGPCTPCSPCNPCRLCGQCGPCGPCGPFGPSGCPFGCRLPCIKPCGLCCGPLNSLTSSDFPLPPHIAAPYEVAAKMATERHSIVSPTQTQSLAPNPAVTAPFSNYPELAQILMEPCRDNLTPKPLPAPSCPINSSLARSYPFRSSPMTKPHQKSIPSLTNIIACFFSTGTGMKLVNGIRIEV